MYKNHQTEEAATIHMAEWQKESMLQETRTEGLEPQRPVLEE